MTEISLHVLDIVENSTKAGAKLVRIGVAVDHTADSLTVTVDDDGAGMDEAQVARVTDPFYTSRTTRKVGLGVPFFKYAAEITGGTFCITSQKGVGTKVEARFVLSSIDCIPLGDIGATIFTLVICHQDTDFVYTYGCRGAEGMKAFTLDTRELREILGGVPFDEPDVSAYIKDYLRENKEEVDGQGPI